MNEKAKVKINIILAGILLFGLFLFCLVKPQQQISNSERRKLHTRPTPTIENVFEKKSGSSFMDDFELYAKDQFPLRETFRTINAISGRYLLGRKEINDLYQSGNYISKMEDSTHLGELVWSAECIQSLIDRYAGDNPVYMAVIPDKNYYLAADKGYPYLDSDLMSDFLEDLLTDNVHFLRLTDKLSAEDYYFADTHWRQEQIPDIAEYLLQEMQSSQAAPKLLPDHLQENTLDKEFYGVYYGQAALPVKAESLHYLTWEGQEKLKVTCYDSGKAEDMQLYTMEKADGMDPYEIFLGGSKSLITIENPNAPEGELVLFRDSFGSSIAPLFTSAYQKITLVDIRYISPAIIGRFVDFDNADILFLYCSSVLNNSVGQFIK